jgi:hypothetical protein
MIILGNIHAYNQSNDRAAQMTFGYAMLGKSWDKLVCKEKNRRQIWYSPPGSQQAMSGYGI